MKNEKREQQSDEPVFDFDALPAPETGRSSEPSAADRAAFDALATDAQRRHEDPSPKTRRVAFLPVRHATKQAAAKAERVMRKLDTRKGLVLSVVAACGEGRDGWTGSQASAKDKGKVIEYWLVGARVKVKTTA